MTTEIVWSRTRPIRKPKGGQVTRRTQPGEREGCISEEEWSRYEEGWRRIKPSESDRI